MCQEIPMYNEIIEPEISIINTLPASLGYKDYFMVLYDKKCFKQLFHDSNGVWSSELENNVADHCADKELPVFVIHAANNNGSEQPKFLPQLCDGEDYFSINNHDYSETITQHCIALKRSSNSLFIKTGFYNSKYSDCDISPSSWKTIDKVGDDLKSLVVNISAFEKAYEKAKHEWSNVKNT